MPRCRRTSAAAAPTCASAPRSSALPRPRTAAEPAMNSPHEFLSLVPALRAAETNSFSEGLAMVTLVRTWGSTFRRPGARMLVRGDGVTLRSLAGGCPDRDLVERALQVIARGRAQLAGYDASSV